MSAEPTRKPFALQKRFDSLGPTLRACPVASGRTARYVDEGRPGWRPVVFFGGLGTSALAFGLTEFARRTREALGLRVVCVERNGFGETPFDPRLGVGDYVDEVLDVLGTLAIERFAIVAMSGGAPYAVALAARVPERVISLHLAAASSGPHPGGATQEFAAMAADLPRLAREPKSFWGYPPSSPVHRIPGFVDAAYAEGARAAFVAGQMGEPGPILHEWEIQARPLPNVSAVAAPVYLYYGKEDALIPPAHIAVWRRAFPNVEAVRLYEDEGHDVQYRHWDQILVDLAGMGDRTIICWQGRSLLVDARQAEGYLARGATLGLCAWAAPQ